MKLLALITAFSISLFSMSTLSGSGLPAHVLLQAVEDALSPLVVANKGQTDISCDPAQTLDLLANAPQKWRVLLALDAENSIEEKSVTGASATTIVAIVQAGIGLNFDPKRDIHRSRAGGSPSLLELAEAVRSWVRGLKLQHPALDQCYGFSWQSSNWVSAEDEGKPPQFARQHNFEVIHLIQRPTAIDPAVINYTA